MVRAPVAYATRRLNSTNSLVVHDDKFREKPFIYVKLYTKPALAAIIDTGCGIDNAANSKARFLGLRQFLEECPIADNDGQLLNAASNEGAL